jgi:PBSX family phage terminase large subunit
MMQDHAAGKVTNAVCFRKVENTCRQSVFSQCLKALDLLKVRSLWKVGLSPLQLTYLPSGTKIMFEGVDDPLKLKSFAADKGYIKYACFEEVSEFSGMEEIRSVLQSVFRGGDEFRCLFSFNPPKQATNWCNAECMIEEPRKVVHHSTYLDVPKAWLGPEFIQTARDLSRRNPDAYRLEYLGEVIGDDSQVFKNVVTTSSDGKSGLVISNTQIHSSFDRIWCGLDWGFSPDPLGIIWGHWDARKKDIWLFDEVYRRELSNSLAAEEIKKRKWKIPIVCDSAEPKSIADLNHNGVRAVKARKGPGSVERGMRFLTREVNHIYIDPVRCPNAVREFLSYAYEMDKNGNYKTGYPDKNNHLIDPTRYGMQDYMTIAKIR